jgi:hypothetical protein
VVNSSSAAELEKGVTKTKAMRMIWVSFMVVDSHVN